VMMTYMPVAGSASPSSVRTATATATAAHRRITKEERLGVRVGLTDQLVGPLCVPSSCRAGVRNGLEPRLLDDRPVWVDWTRIIIVVVVVTFNATAISTTTTSTTTSTTTATATAASATAASATAASATTTHVTAAAEAATTTAACDFITSVVALHWRRFGKVRVGRAAFRQLLWFSGQCVAVSLGACCEYVLLQYVMGCAVIRPPITTRLSKAASGRWPQ
jgi:hypothetical protein